MRSNTPRRSWGERARTGPHGCFVAGTDTDVGKTRMSAALLHWMARRGLVATGFKPVAAGATLIDGARVNKDLALPVVPVVGLRLGCLNHALVTTEAIKARHLPLAGWIANTIDPAMAYPEHNMSTLRHELDERQRVPCLGVVPWLDAPHPNAVAAHLNDAALRSAFGLPERIAPVATLDI